jgi:hypothetical protein
MTKRPAILWTGAITCLGVAWLAISAIGFGPGTRSIVIRLLLSGGAFIGPAIYVRHRCGGVALAGVLVFTVAVMATAWGKAFAASMDLFEYGLGVLAAFVMLAPSLSLAALVLHWLAKRPPRPMLERDFPIALAVFALAQVLGFGLALAVAVFTVPIIGH